MNSDELIFDIIIPLPCSVNGAYAGMKRRHKSKAYKSWLSSLPKVMALGIDEPIYIIHELTFKNRINRDVGNYTKLTEDWLVSSGVLLDDNFNIIKFHVPIFVGIDKENSHSRVKIYRISGDEVHLNLCPGY